MTSPVTSKQVFSYIYSVVKSFPLALCVMVLTSSIWAIDLSVRPYILKEILNRLPESKDQNIFDALAIPVLLYLGMYLLMTTSFRLYGYFVEIKMLPNLRAKIANDSLRLLLDKSHTYYQNNYAGSLTKKFNDLIDSVPEFLQIMMDRFLGMFLALLIAILTLGTVNIMFGIFMFVWAGIFIGGGLLFSKHFTRLSDQYSSYFSIITGKVVDVLSNILSVRLFATKTQEINLLKETFQGAVQADQKLHWSYFWMWFCYGYSFFILQAANFYFLMKGYQEGWVTVGDFALILVINISIVDYTWKITKDISEFSKLIGRITQALRNILDVPEIQDASNSYDLIVTDGNIVFDHVKFHYKGIAPLFEDKCITLDAGQKIGLVGYSGGGKSTFVNLILRLYEITNGRILIDGQNIQTVTQDSLHHAIGMIPQDPFLFHRSLLENIRYGRLDAKDEEVIDASQKAHAHDFISKFPSGYNSLVGERGIKLSGGQRQRIAIARSILKNAPILILDEATSHLDSITEQDIQKSLWTLMQGKTTIVIAHRLSTLLNMDRILVFENGKIVQDGTHATLIASQGLYKTLWDTQIGGFLPEKKDAR
ncbi:MAG TPA: ABC transporter ATP-binding protein [Alphaproteobacteria bacterium]|nr:ABC transporter ATP-binding protein [Alphaproteobacteria bacterium]HQS94617.1 ABC transporter ATP-binding protein [Alphaproteobacteria bacterium]